MNGIASTFFFPNHSPAGIEIIFSLTIPRKLGLLVILLSVLMVLIALKLWAPLLYRRWRQGQERRRERNEILRRTEWYRQAKAERLVRETQSVSDDLKALEIA
jgi:hypothetical protein